MSLTVQQQWLQYLTSRSTARVFPAIGDSYMSGAGGVSFADDIRADTGAVVINCGAGGTTINDQLVQLQSVPWLFGRKFLWWDGSPNSYGTPATYLAVIDQMLSIIGANNFAALCPLAVGPPTGDPTPWIAYVADMRTIYSGMVSRGIKTFDVQTYLVALNDPADSTSTALGLVGPASTQDGTHLISALMTGIAAKFKTDVIDANGW